MESQPGRGGHPEEEITPAAQQGSASAGQEQQPPRPPPSQAQQQQAEARQRHDSAPPAVVTVDGEALPAAAARALSRRNFRLGFCALPWLWAVNVWLFWPELRGGADVAVQKYVRWSALCFAGASALFLPWLFAFSIGGPRLFGQAFFDKWSATSFDWTQLLQA